MASSFTAPSAHELFQALRPLLKEGLAHVDAHRFADAANTLANAKRVHDTAFQAEADEQALREMFALGQTVALHQAYATYWAHVVSGSFAESWSTLQDALDALRHIKRFSSIDVSFFESQLTAIESTYPYRIFASVGAIADRFECNICGEDIDSLDCTHRRGELYAGKMAYGIARELRLEHVSLVTNPVDKRCVMRLPDHEEAFPFLECIRDQLTSGELKIGWLEQLDWSEREELHLAGPMQGRNSPCACGSGKKFKKCCRDKPAAMRKHVEIVPRVRDLPSVVV